MNDDTLEPKSIGLLVSFIAGLFTVLHYGPKICRTIKNIVVAFCNFVVNVNDLTPIIVKNGPSLLEATPSLLVIAKEFSPNGGKSIKDRINRIDDLVVHHTEILAGQDKVLERLVGDNAEIRKTLESRLQQEGKSDGTLAQH